METKGKFYLGRIFDLQTKQATEQPLLYDPADLTTHAVVVGMTGSGKTGLCIALLEEAALNGVPALMIDPKGDLTNLLLHFPNLAPQDFQPWINADLARRQGQTVEEAARQTAALWREGLAQWGIGAERLQALQDAAGYRVYTPGSTSGAPVNILASFRAPQADWESEREFLREKISSTVTALLGLVGLQGIDAVRSREHILLANLFEHAWSQGRDLQLDELILQTQSPPFPRLGVFDVDTFFPEKERFELAMRLNSILAAPTFQSWLEGDPLDIQALLYLPDGRPRHNVFYLAHLSDAERMFFVALFYAALESWMRAQPGTNALRLIVYFDEIFGYLPPISNPPSKPPLLRLLKQGRAFGVGQVLATQNPSDLDYKALANAGAWFIGKLQTEQDKSRLLEGLVGAGEGMPEPERYEQLISRLEKRVFLLHNVHAAQPVVFQSRWTMNYLAGPLTRPQLAALKQQSGAPSGETPASESSSLSSPLTSSPQLALDRFQAVPAPEIEASDRRRLTGEAEAEAVLGTSTRPALPAGIAEYFLPNNLTFTQAFKAAGQPFPDQAFSQGILYRPALLAQAQVRFVERKYGVDQLVALTALALEPDRRGIIRWEEARSEPIEARILDREPIPQAQFAPLSAPFTDGRLLKVLQNDFQDWVYRTARLTVRQNAALGVYAGPDVSAAEFRRMCAEQARRRRDAEIEKTRASYIKKIQALELRLEREMHELDADETELSQRRIEEWGTHAENMFSLFSKSRRRISTSLTKRRLTEQARADVEESRKAIRSLQGQIAALQAELEEAVQALSDRWGALAVQDSEISLAPFKKDIFIELFGVAWFPYHRIQLSQGWIELPGFSPELMA